MSKASEWAKTRQKGSRRPAFWVNQALGFRVYPPTKTKQVRVHVITSWRLNEKIPVPRMLMAARWILDTFEDAPRA